VGRVSLEKNLPFLLRTWRTFRTLHPDANANLIIVGDGPYLPAMREAARAIGNIFFTGQLHGKDLAALYAGADLFLFPSLTDTLGQSAIEAQASALPAIVSDTGGPQDVIVPGVTGLALPARDTDACARAWADAIAQLCHDHQRRRSMAAAAHAHAQRYSLTASYEHYWRLHESVRSSAPPAPDPGTRSRAAGAG
jgi:glycosyltransferase involved in cell wall biosynthesis